MNKKGIIPFTGGFIVLLLLGLWLGNIASKEEEYKRGIKLIEQGEWSQAGSILGRFESLNYKDGRVLYCYAVAKQHETKGDYSMATHVCNDVTEDYSGKMADEILAFKKEIIAKTEQEAMEMDKKSKADSEANKITPGCHKVYIGMSSFEAEISMGKPYDINRTIGSYGTHEQWCYNGGVYLYFDNDILTSWQD